VALESYHRRVTALIIGCGFTGLRVARTLRAAQIPVIATTRDPNRRKALEEYGAEIWDIDVKAGLDGRRVPDSSRVLISVPTLDTYDPTPEIVRSLAGKAVRLVYLSTTGVYGQTIDVDENTPPSPRQEREKLRFQAEEAVRSAGASWMVLRPAAIYGPGRGIQVSMQNGTFRLAGDGSNFVSRIHVDDLAAHATAALISDLIGAYPVADEEPCTSREIAEFCSKLLNVPMPPSVEPGQLHSTRQANRRVDGRAVRQLLGVTLRYRSYRTGIPASLGM
jgi:nucleoside-diphosphate-sugar epimerase